MTISQQATDVRGDRFLQGRPGEPSQYSPFNSVRDFINSAPQAKQTATVVVDTATNSTIYTYTVNGVDITTTSDASATKIEIADALAVAHNSEPAVRGQVVAVSDGVDTVTLTSTVSGLAFTASDSDSRLTTSAGTSNAAADSIGFGLILVALALSASDRMPPCALPKSSLYTAQVMTGAFTYQVGKIIRCQVIDKHSGAVIADAEHVQAADLATSITALVAQLNAQLPANTVVAVAGATSWTLTAEKAGLEFDANVSSDDSVNVLETIAYTTGPSPVTSLIRSFIGLSKATLDEETTTIGGDTVAYPANAGVKVGQEGHYWVSRDSSETISFGDGVYVEMDATSDDIGKCFQATSSTRLLLPSVIWERTDTGDVATDLIGEISFNWRSTRAAAQ